MKFTAVKPRSDPVSDFITLNKAKIKNFRVGTSGVEIELLEGETLDFSSLKAELEAKGYTVQVR